VRIISGGQTGVDRAALDTALRLGLPCGGWCPRGRRAEDGPIDSRYPLQETPWDGYPQRTEWNVRDSGATLILTLGPYDRGTALTAEMARRYGRPVLVVDLATNPASADARAWLRETGTATLNVAGPRESSAPGIHARAGRFLREMLAGEAGEAEAGNSPGLPAPEG
jgi:hypothetical protein